MKVLVVIVCYRVPDLTIDCLRSLSTEIPTVPGLEVAICENGTGADSAERIARAIETEGWSEWARLTVISPNCGFAGGNNVILRPAMDQPEPPDAFLLLNADTIVRPGALASLVAAMEARPDVGVVGPRLECPDGSPQVSCFRYLSPASEFLAACKTGPIWRLLGRYVVGLDPRDEPSEPEWVSFACALIRREVVEQVGCLDDHYYLYFDDVDYCRLVRNAGWKVMNWPAARVVHLHGRSNPVESCTAQRKRRPRYYYASRARYFAKHYGRLGLWAANLLWLGGRTISLARELVGNKRPHTCKAEWRDIWTNWRDPARVPSPPGLDST
jgi:GT2 family glycosyltransferase